MLNKFFCIDSKGISWAFELPEGQTPALGTTGWMLPVSSTGTKEILAGGCPTTDWHKSLRKDNSKR